MRKFSLRAVVALTILCGTAPAWAEAPVASYIFPAGGQRGTTVKLRVGGLFLNKSCTFDLEGQGLTTSKTLTRMPTRWFEGPLLELPDSQRQEDYPKDMAGEVKLAPDSPLGLASWRVATSQGATPGKLFQIGDLPEIVEDEIDGEPIAIAVKLPLTINGRIFPRQNVDAWSFTQAKGQTVVCEVHAARLGSPLEPRLEIRDAAGKRLAESDLAGDPRLAFTAPADGTYEVRIHDVNYNGSQAHVYRLTLRTGPFVERVFPLGGQRGKQVTVELDGHQLPAKTATVALPTDGATHRHQLPGSNAFLLEVDDFPEVVEGKTETINPPAICNGRILRPGETDVWTFAARKNVAMQVELRAAKLGSSLDGVLTIVDAAGKELATADGGANLDPTLRFTAPADGNYQVRVQDRFRSRGGPSFAYRLRLVPATTAPDFRLQFKTDAISLVRGTTAKLPITLERIGDFTDPVTLSIDNLPAGVTVTGNTIAAKQNTTELTFKCDQDATIRSARLTLRGAAKVAGQDVTRIAQLAVATDLRPVDTVLLAVSLPTPFKLKGEYDMRWASRGSQHSRHYKIERNGFDGPLVIALTDKQARHLQGVTAAEMTVPAGATEFDYVASLPPWMETARTSRTCVMATGLFKDKDGSVHEITFSSVHQNEQMVAVIEPGKLEITLDKSSLRADPNKTLALPFKIARAPGLKGPVRIELVLAPHIKDVRAEAVTLTDQQTDGTLNLVLGQQPGPFNVPLLFRATLTSQNRPYIAETALDVVPTSSR